MKKIKIVFLVVLVILFVVISMMLLGNGITHETEYARKLPFESDKYVLGIFFLGGLEEDYDYSLVEKYYSNEDIKSFEQVEIAGEECYLIVPRYNGKVKVSSLTMTEDGGTSVKTEKELAKPFFIKCNASDIFSNVEISLEHEEVEYKYSPYISLKDGSIVTEDFVLLITKWKHINIKYWKLMTSLS